MSDSSTSRSVRNYIRISLLLLILPVLYITLWISIATDDSLTFFEQVQLLMSYFPEGMRDPYYITMIFFGMSLGSAIFSFYGYLKSSGRSAQITNVAICCIATLLTLWLGFTLL